MTPSVSPTIPTLSTLIRGARVATPGGSLVRADVLINHGRVAMLKRSGSTRVDPDGPALRALQVQKGIRVVQAPEGSLLTPGLIDQHTHGGYGVNFNLSSVGDMKAFLDKLPAHGITRIVPTVMTGSVEELETALKNLESLKHFTDGCRGVQIEGIHLEGPFINTAKRGAHNETLVNNANAQGLALLRRLIAIAPDIKLVTLAPELDPDGVMTRYLTSRDIKVNAGHTAATADDMTRAISQGVTGMTHTFNAMDGIHHRTPGPIPVALASRKVYPEIIADGHHVDPAVVSMFLNGTKNAVLVSDGMGLAGSEEGAEGELGGQTVYNRGGAAVNEEGNLAGSTVFVSDCVKNVADWGLKTFAQAVNLASKNPADHLGLGDHLGRIAPGYAADLVLWSPSHEVLSTWINGREVYKNTAAVFDETV